jgi:hypothetical protein
MNYLETIERNTGRQPIETAPKDGTAILVCVAGYEPAVAKWCPDRKRLEKIFAEEFSEEETWKLYKDETKTDVWDLTHWMPLPPAPVP